ncbi:MAG: helix-turn-helix domain-containing protein [Pseudomonadota bacterium]
MNSPPRQLTWSPQGAARQLEILDRATLFKRIPRALLTQPERLDFQLVIVCYSGAGEHAVDGVTVPVGQGVVLHIQPGQIHQWAGGATYGAWLILAYQLPLVPVSRTVGPRVRHVSQGALRTTSSLVKLIGQPPARAEDRLAAERAVADLLAITLRLTAPDPLPAGPYAALYLALRNDVATWPDVRLNLSQRAARLGCSSRTLTRACLAISGRTAKQETDALLALEARRLLAVPALSVTQIATALGFSEATNFTKFVRRTTGAPPATWRRRA